MDLSLKGPPFNPLQEATVYQALQCFADCLSCLSLKKKTKNPLHVHVCTSTVCECVCGRRESRLSHGLSYFLQGAALYPWFCPQFCFPFTPR